MLKGNFTRHCIKCFTKVHVFHLLHPFISAKMEAPPRCHMLLLPFIRSISLAKRSLQFSTAVAGPHPYFSLESLIFILPPCEKPTNMFPLSAASLPGTTQQLKTLKLPSSASQLKILLTKGSPETDILP